MIYTGYYAKLKTYEKAGLQPVSIAGRAPDFYKGPQYKSLAPEYKMFMDWKKGRINNSEYTTIFLKHLETLDKEAVRRALEGFGEDVILLCYEKPGDFCHRHIVADWLESNFGWRVDEYDQVEQDRKAQAIKDLKSFYLNATVLATDYQIEEVDRFIQELEENPPEGYFLYKKIRDNDVEYTLEDSQEFLKEYNITLDK